MKNPVPYIRKSLFTLLNGQVMNGTDAVPVYEGEGGKVPYQVLIKEYSDADKSNKQFFSGKASQIIEIVGEQHDASAKVVDQIAGEVMNLIKPDTRTSGIPDSVDFQVMIIGKPSISNLTEDSGSGTKIIRRILRYSLIIIER